MSLADELAKLEELRRGGALSEAEFAAAKKKLLGEPAAASAEPALGEHLAAQLEEVKFQNELAQLDREWELEREKYMVTGRYGQRHIPTTSESAIGGTLVVGFGVIWTLGAVVMAVAVFGFFNFASDHFSDHPAAGPASAAFSIFPCLFPCFGVLFIAAGIVMSKRAYAKAQQYERAHEAYQRRRRELLAHRGG